METCFPGDDQASPHRIATSSAVTSHDDRRADVFGPGMNVRRFNIRAPAF
jgi:hypothetical protein